MSAPHPAPAAPEPAIDPDVARAERRLRVLATMGDKGLDVTLAIEADGSPQSAETFAKVSRAVRLTVTLEAKLDAIYLAWRAAVAAQAPPPFDQFMNDDGHPAETKHERVRAGRKGQVRELVVDVADHEIPDPDEYERLTDALDERLLRDEAYSHLEDLPIREIVERLCADLKLKPDWSRWTGKGWKPNPPFFRPRRSQFREPSAIPILPAVWRPEAWE